MSSLSPFGRYNLNHKLKDSVNNLCAMCASVEHLQVYPDKPDGSAFYNAGDESSSLCASVRARFCVCMCLCVYVCICACICVFESVQYSSAFNKNFDLQLLLVSLPQKT